ncbi:MAG TPA: sensor histidine kinase [Acidimicrobiales bacterium]|nr:sensor histidine kinase [Acidimicrobiales bacterium]
MALGAGTGTRQWGARQWGARQWKVDLATSAAIALVQVGGFYALSAHRGLHIGWLGAVLVWVGPLALVARRRFPVAVLAITNAATLAYVVGGGKVGAMWLSLVVAFVSAIYLRKRVEALAFLAICYALGLWGPEAAGTGPGPSAALALGVGGGLAFMVGASEWVRLARQRSLAQARAREEEAKRMASEERVRIAREIHDVLTHNISVINVQASTALHLLDRQPERARQALSTINDISKQALSELRAVLGVLRTSGEAAPLSPVPTLAELDRLVENMRAAGLEVRVEEEGPRHGLPVDVDLAAYRVVQEALTNTARHSGAARALVKVRYGTGSLVVEVTDDGPNGTANDPANAAGPGTRMGVNRDSDANGAVSGKGSGILGMGERVSALGGTLEAGPLPRRGFRVLARIPTSGATSGGAS